jgi:hypothetical protein
LILILDLLHKEHQRVVSDFLYRLQILP